MTCSKCFDDGTVIVSEGYLICDCDLGRRITVALKLIAHGDTTLTPDEPAEPSDDKVNEAIAAAIVEQRRAAKKE